MHQAEGGCNVSLRGGDACGVLHIPVLAAGSKQCNGHGHWRDQTSGQYSTGPISQCVIGPATLAPGYVDLQRAWVATGAVWMRPHIRLECQLNTNKLRSSVCTLCGSIYF